MRVYRRAIADNSKRNPKYLPMITKSVDERIDAGREQSGHSELLTSQPSPVGKEVQRAGHVTDPSD
jgi:hypothetical protein